MADPFQPKFVDLVRNFSTTTGTGNFVLGPAANGYTSFTAACQAGDSFYYSAINVDKPAEREVGRGTLLAGGVISRDAIIGSETNFSSGNKSIALIAAADWLSTVHSTVSALGALPSVASTRTALAAVTQRQAPALLCEAGREGLFTWDGSNLSAKVSADSAQGIYVAPATDPSGATGAWVRRFDGAVNVRWFGAIGDDAANDGAAFSAALAVLQALAPANGPYGYQGRGAQSLFIPAGRYFLGTTTLDITSTLIIEGQGVGSEAAQSTVLRWAGDTTGIRVQSADTSGATTSGLSLSTSGAGTIIRNLELYGAYSGSNQGDYHGTTCAPERRSRTSSSTSSRATASTSSPTPPRTTATPTNGASSARSSRTAATGCSSTVQTSMPATASRSARSATGNGASTTARSWGTATWRAIRRRMPWVRTRPTMSRRTTCSSAAIRSPISRLRHSSLRRSCSEGCTAPEFQASAC